MINIDKAHLNVSLNTNEDSITINDKITYAKRATFSKNGSGFRDVVELGLVDQTLMNGKKLGVLWSLKVVKVLIG